LAEESFRRAQQIAPRDGDVMHNYAWFLCQERRFPEAETLFRQALAQPQYLDTVRTHLALGVCQARAGRMVEAEGTLTRAYELDPGNPATAFNLSDVLFRRGEYERVRFYMRRVNALQEQANAQTLWLAARAEYRLGNTVGARQLGNQLRDRFPQSPEAMQFEKGRFDD
jgi:type IV pilus assembly protein PilF